MTSLMLPIRVLLTAGLISYQACFSSSPESTQEDEPSASLLASKHSPHLTRFFERLLIENPGSYTLLGTKPITNLIITAPRLETHPVERCVIGRKIFTPLPLAWECLQYETGTFRERDLAAWEAWNEFSKTISTPGFIIHHAQRGKWHDIHLIQEKAARAVINENLDLFQEALGANFTAEHFLSQLQNEPYQFLFETLLKGRHDLYGILLGFGRENATAWARMHALEHIVSSASDHYPFHLFAAGPDEDPVSMPMVNRHPLNLPAFASLDNEETAILYARYSTEQRIIAEYYKERDFLNATLEALTKSPHL